MERSYWVVNYTEIEMNNERVRNCFLELDSDATEGYLKNMVADWCDEYSFFRFNSAYKLSSKLTKEDADFLNKTIR